MDYNISFPLFQPLVGDLSKHFRLTKIYFLYCFFKISFSRGFFPSQTPVLRKVSQISILSRLVCHTSKGYGQQSAVFSS